MNTGEWINKQIIHQFHFLSSKQLEEANEIPWIFFEWKYKPNNILIFYYSYNDKSTAA